MNLFTSDLHFGHEKIAKLRGFASSFEHDEFVCSEIREQVTNHDVLWILGDVALDANGHTAALRYLWGLICEVRIVAGNHDKFHPMQRGYVGWHKRFSEVFDWVGTQGYVRIDGTRWHLSHFPRLGEGADHTDEARFEEWRPTARRVLHGHTHLTGQRYHDGQIHVGWDAWKRLVTEQDIMNLLKEYE